MVMRNTCLYPHNRCSFNGPSFSVRRVELCWYMEKMDRIPDGSLCVFASMSMSMQISITMSDALKKISISYNGLAIFSPLISSSVFLKEAHFSFSCVDGHASAVCQVQVVPLFKPTKDRESQKKKECNTEKSHCALGSNLHHEPADGRAESVEGRSRSF